MSFTDERRLLENQLNANWTTTPIKWENVEFTDDVDSTNNPQAYVAFTLRPGAGEQIDLGLVPLFRWAGVVILQIFIPEYQPGGPALAEQYAETLKGFFLRQTLSLASSGRVLTRVPNREVIGVTQGFYQVNLVIPFIRDNTS